MLQMRALLRVSPNLPPPVRAALGRGDADAAKAMFDLGLDCTEIKELLDRKDCCTPEASAA